jgi:hypothetical protein
MNRKVSPPDALSPAATGFNEAVAKASNALLAAVQEFEKATGRTCDGIHLSTLDVTRIEDAEPRHIRQAGLAWLPTQAEIDEAERFDRYWRSRG